MRSWPAIETVAQYCPLPDGYQLRSLRRSDVHEVIALFRRVYPDIAVGSESCHLQEHFYETSVALDGRSGDYPIFAAIVVHSDTIVGILTYERDVSAGTVFGRCGTIAKEHRGLRLAQLGPAMLDALARLTGAELAYTFVT